MEDVEEKPQAETTEENTKVITSTVEPAVNSLGDNSIVEPLSKSTNASDTQSVSQDESIPIDTFDELEQSHQEAAALEDIFDRQHDDTSTILASSDVDNSDSPPANITDVRIENYASTQDAEVHVTEQSHQEALAADSEPEALEDIFNKKQDDGSMVVSGFDDPMEILASSDNKEVKMDQPQTKATDVALGAGVSLPPTAPKQTAENRGIIDTAAPFESVKEAVSKFGGIVNWKSHKMQTVERRKEVHEELEKAKDEIPEYRKRSDAAEQEKFQVLEELDRTKRLIEVLKLNLERAEIEERQARQDSELAKLRVEEMEQGVAEVSSFASKAQLEVAKARYTAAITELTSVKEELEELRKGFSFVVTEKDEAVKKAEEAVAESKQVEKSVEDLTIELISMKESLENAHMEEEEHRIGTTTMEREQYFLDQKNLSAEDLKSKLSKASAFLHDLKAELNAYTESKGDIEKEEILQTHNEIQAAVASAKKELEEVKLRIEKTTAEVNYLKVAATSLRSEIEREKLSLASLRQREGGEILQLPKKLEQATKEANQASLLTQAARKEMDRVKEEAEQAKASARTMQSRLASAQKEIESTRASERLAIAALQESESSRSNSEVDSSNIIMFSVEEYYQLSKQVHEAEEKANRRVAAANYEIEIAKESELKVLEKLNQVNKEMADRRESMKIAMDKAEKARVEKLGVEQELGKWSAEPKDGEIGHGNQKSSHSSNFSINELSSPKTGKNKKKKKKQRTLYTISLTINCKNSRN